MRNSRSSRPWIGLPIVVIATACGSTPPATTAPHVEAAPPSTPPHLRDACAAEDWAACADLADQLYDATDAKPEAARLYMLACEHAVSDACWDVGLMWEDGIGVTRDRDRALHWYGLGCALGAPTGCLNGGLLLQDRRGDVAADDAAAVEAFRAGCELGDAKSCTNLGLALDEGRGVAPDPDRALALWRSTCEAGHGTACVDVGAHYQQGQGVPLDLAEAFRRYRQACAAESVEGCYRLATLLELGRGTTLDVPAAERLYLAACEHDHALACAAVGRLYEQGVDGHADEINAARYYERACDLDEPESCSAMAYFYLSGKGVPRDPQRSGQYGARACLRGNLSGCRYEGYQLMYQEPARAVTILEPACDGGDFPSCAHLGLLFEFGAGRALAVDLERASRFYEHACAAPPEPDVASDCEAAERVLAKLPATSENKARTRRVHDQRCAAQATSPGC
jgi:TPR repeat protein